MGAAANHNQNTLSETQVAGLLGYESISYAERILVSQGIKPFYGRPGHWFITIDQLNAARGILRAVPNDDNYDQEPL